MLTFFIAIQLQTLVLKRMKLDYNLKAKFEEFNEIKEAWNALNANKHHSSEIVIDVGRSRKERSKPQQFKINLLYS